MKKKGCNFHQEKINSIFELTDEMLFISGKEWDELVVQHNSFFQNTFGVVICWRNIYNIAKKGQPTGFPHFLEYIFYAKTIM